jgi:uncharacterized membrane protein YtjA (UPF0391 family)
MADVPWNKIASRRRFFVRNGTLAPQRDCGIDLRWRQTMSILKWALIFLVISVIAGVFGFTGVSVASADIARVLFYIFIAIFLVLLILGFTVFRA